MPEVHTLAAATAEPKQQQVFLRLPNRRRELFPLTGLKLAPSSKLWTDRLFWVTGLSRSGCSLFWQLSDEPKN